MPSQPLPPRCRGMTWHRPQNHGGHLATTPRAEWLQSCMTPLIIWNSLVAPSLKIFLKPCNDAKARNMIWYFDVFRGFGMILGMIGMCSWAQPWHSTLAAATAEVPRKRCAERSTSSHPLHSPGSPPLQRGTKGSFLSHIQLRKHGERIAGISFDIVLYCGL